MKNSICTYLVSILVFFPFLFDDADACWGVLGPDYVDMTHDYDLLVDSEMVINCTLKNRNITISNKRINSSDLIIEKYNDTQYASKFTRVVDDRTVQLKIPKATTNDTGFYVCKIFLSKDIIPITACVTRVKVGYPPHHIKEFSCVSRNFDNIKCTWNTEKNNVFTKYTISKKISITLNSYQMCPTNTVKPNSCEWSRETDPVFLVESRDIYFKVEGKNTFGTSVEEFKVGVYSIVIPNSPENLEILDIRQQSATIRWKPPTMRNIVLENFNFKLKYEIRISKVSHEFSDVTVYETENCTTNFLLENLIPHVTYNVTVRCRSAYRKNDSMWSDFISAVFKTPADVPYKSPDVIPEAFELQTYEYSRSATLYWKAVPKIHYNGEGFHYHIRYYQNVLTDTTEISTINKSHPFMHIKDLQKNSSYTFKIYSANENGTSKDFGFIFIDSEEKTLPAPKKLTVTQQDIGKYNLTWISPNDVDTFRYIVFWCSSLKPWLSRCDNSINWTDAVLTETNLLLDLSDMKANFYFAVVSQSQNSSSAMQWAPCILPHTSTHLNTCVGPPQNIDVKSYSNNSFFISWSTLQVPYEILTEYIVSYNGSKRSIFGDGASRTTDSTIIDGLKPYSTYAVQIQTCLHIPTITGFDCSDMSEPIMIQTDVGVPGYIKPPRLEIFNSTCYKVSWEAPILPNGPIDFYELMWHEEENVSAVSNKIVQISSANSVIIELKCNLTDEGTTFLFQVRAVNKKNSKNLFGPYSESTQIKDCQMPKDELMWHQEEDASAVSNKTVKISSANSVIIELKCNLTDEGTTFLFQVRAVNKKNSKNLFGPYSESTQIKDCQIPIGLGLFARTIVFGTLVITLWGMLFMVKIMYGISLSDRFVWCHMDRSFDYVHLQITKAFQHINKKPEILQIRCKINKLAVEPEIPESVTLEEGEYTKLGRKSGGNNNDCTYITSSITLLNNLYSENNTSCADLDFLISSSPDSDISESSLQISHKISL